MRVYAGLEAAIGIFGLVSYALIQSLASAPQDFEELSDEVPHSLKVVIETAVGEVIHIRATDPSTDRDFQNFCRFLGHELVASELQGDVLEFWIKKSDN